MSDRVPRTIVVRRGYRIGSVFLVLAAFAITAYVVRTTVSDLDLRAHGVQTSATITDVTMNIPYPYGVPEYGCMAEYVVPGGSHHSMSFPCSRDARVGDTVAIIYDPLHPGTADTTGVLSGRWWTFPAFLLLVALACGGLSVYAWRKATRRREAQGN
ncbi:MAG TPA: DUF3592 domain-containing protein [Actinocrinis sp.]|uniref:DUF3592 domain-containing protein n=1 Tax=Actinocrinis sp. TaxID=1920516 RepID=UPI002DDCA529|nr:DUF3592 domain-containing protein [Actinocrinis sp.]HEV2347081.1 DUF3592 domain-containing protein [Actinocrinis sp.]